MNLSPAVVRVRPVWKRPERRFPLRYLRPRPALAHFPGWPLPLPAVLDELPGLGTSSQRHRTGTAPVTSRGMC